MFLRRWSALPADPIFPTDMKQLGYFINEDDEIRNIDKPNTYFKYFISKNMRWNDRQRFSMNAVESLIHTRLSNQGMTKLLLPLGTPPTKPHVPIFVSANIATASRVVVLFGESCQDLGVLAHRVAGGPGGVNKGSMVSVVAAIRASDKSGSIGVVIANPGQLWWWPEGGRGLTPAGRFAVPMRSAVHRGRAYDARLNAIQGHETVGRHVSSVFEEVLGGGVVSGDARLAVVAVTDVADEVEKFLDDEENWNRFGGRMESLALLGNFYGVGGVKCEGFGKFLKERARAWVSDSDPINVPLANPEGSETRPGVGCPVLSAGPAAYLSELLLIHTSGAVLKWIRDVASVEDYKNEHFEIIQMPPEPADARFWKGEFDNEEKSAGEAKDASEKNADPSWEDDGMAASAGKAEPGDKPKEDKVATATETAVAVNKGKVAIEPKATVTVNEDGKASTEAKSKKSKRSASPDVYRLVPIAADGTPQPGIFSNLSEERKAAIKEAAERKRQILELERQADEAIARQRAAEAKAKREVEAKANAEAEERARLDHMRHEVLAGLMEIEKLAAERLENGDKEEDSDSDEE